MRNLKKLLWTGGWDSTFRLLQLLLEETSVVQPYYIIDSGRISTRMELETMQTLRKNIIETYHGTAELFLPTIFTELSCIKPDKQITDSFKMITKYQHLGIQYEWMARFCKQFSFQNIEIGIEKKPSGVEDTLLPYLYNGIDDDNFKKPDFYNILKPKLEFLFSFYDMPLKDITKKMMYDIALEKDWMNGIMDKTWFCHHPTKNNRSCGLCKPCGQVIENHFEWRIPMHNRGLYHLRKLKQKINLMTPPKREKTYDSISYTS